MGLEKQAEGCSTASSSAYAVGQPVIPFHNLTLGPLLGKGGYGQVYRGVLGDGKLVAVKVCSSVLADLFTDLLQNTPDCCCKMLVVAVSCSTKTFHAIKWL